MSISYVLIILVVIVGIVFGIIRWSKSRGKIQIILDKNSSYAKGEIVKGKIVVDLKKTIHTSGLDLKLMATAYVSVFPNQIKNDSEGVYEQVFPIAGEGDFSRREFPFEVQIPQDMNNASGSLIKIKNDPSEQVGWFLQANLKIPGSLDISNLIVLDVQ